MQKRCSRQKSRRTPTLAPLMAFTSAHVHRRCASRRPSQVLQIAGGPCVHTALDIMRCYKALKATVARVLPLRCLHTECSQPHIANVHMVHVVAGTLELLQEQLQTPRVGNSSGLCPATAADAATQCAGLSFADVAVRSHLPHHRVVLYRMWSGHPSLASEQLLTSSRITDLADEGCPVSSTINFGVCCRHDVCKAVPSSRTGRQSRPGCLHCLRRPGGGRQMRAAVACGARPAAAAQQRRQPHAAARWEPFWSQRSLLSRAPGLPLSGEAMRPVMLLH